MAAAQMVEWSLLTPEIHSLNPNIGKVISTSYKLNRKYKKTRLGTAHLQTNSPKECALGFEDKHSVFSGRTLFLYGLTTVCVPA